MKKTTSVLLTAALSTGTIAALAVPAHADIERSRACGQARVELNVDREGGGFEVDADIDGADPGSRWRVVLRHDGRIFYDRVRSADREGDLDVDRWRDNTAGADTFRVTVRQAGTSQRCDLRIVTR